MEQGGSSTPRGAVPSISLPEAPSRRTSAPGSPRSVGSGRSGGTYSSMTEDDARVSHLHEVFYLLLAAILSTHLPHSCPFSLEYGLQGEKYFCVTERRRTMPKSATLMRYFSLCLTISSGMCLLSLTRSLQVCICCSCDDLS